MTTLNNPQSILSEYQRLCEVCAEVWSANIGILSLSTMDVLYVSNHFAQTTGIQTNTKAPSRTIFAQLLHPKEFPSIARAHLQTLNYFKKHYLHTNIAPHIDAKYYLKLRMADGHYENHLAVIHPVSYSENGLPPICFILLKPENKVGAEKYSISTPDNQRLYFSNANNKYVPKENLELKPIECRILELTAKGYGEVKIAKTLDIKLDLLRYYKKSIYKKYHVSNITEAVYTAIQNSDIAP